MVYFIHNILTNMFQPESRPSSRRFSYYQNKINLWTPNVNYSGRTAPLTSKVAFYIFIQQI